MNFLAHPMHSFVSIFPTDNYVPIQQNGKHKSSPTTIQSKRSGQVLTKSMDNFTAMSPKYEFTRRKHWKNSGFENNKTYLGNKKKSPTPTTT